MLAAAARAGARGGKVCGAGGGGCLFCIGDPEDVPGIRAALADRRAHGCSTSGSSAAGWCWKPAPPRRSPEADFPAVDNLAIARVLAEIADLLEIRGENPFKIRAYRNAADTIAHLGARAASLSRGRTARDPGHRQGSRRPASPS